MSTTSVRRGAENGDSEWLAEMHIDHLAGVMHGEPVSACARTNLCDEAAGGLADTGNRRDGPSTHLLNPRQSICQWRSGFDSLGAYR